MSKELPPMFLPFDSYVEDGRIVIVTTGEKREVQLNSISISRAEEILKNLQETIKSFKKSQA